MAISYLRLYMSVPVYISQNLYSTWAYVYLLIKVYFYICICIHVFRLRLLQINTPINTKLLPSSDFLACIQYLHLQPVGIPESRPRSSFTCKLLTEFRNMRNMSSVALVNTVMTLFEFARTFNALFSFLIQC